MKIEFDYEIQTLLTDIKHAVQNLNQTSGDLSLLSTEICKLTIEVDKLNQNLTEAKRVVAALKREDP